MSNSRNSGRVSGLQLQYSRYACCNVAVAMINNVWWLQDCCKTCHCQWLQRLLTMDSIMDVMRPAVCMALGSVTCRARQTQHPLTPVGSIGLPRCHMTADILLCFCMSCSEYGIEVRHMWGMTELSPLGSIGLPTGAQLAEGMSKEDLINRKVCRLLAGL